MERLEGIKVTDEAAMSEANVDRVQLAKDGANVFLEMIFRDGFFHADPHPGNLIILDRAAVEGGHQIGLLDCGMVGRIDQFTRGDWRICCCRLSARMWRGSPM